MDVWYFLAGVGMVGVAVGSVGWWYWRGARADAIGRSRVSPFAWGALAWLIGGLVLKVPAAVVLAPLFQGGGGLTPGPAAWLAMGLMTGVCETATAAGLAWALVRRAGTYASYWRAVAFGIGFGAAEALVVALDPLLSPLDTGATTTPVAYTFGEALETAAAPVVERLNAMPVHALACALAVDAVRRRRWGPFWLAFLYKTMVDALPAEKLAAWGTWAMVRAYLPFGIVGVIGLVALRRRWAVAPQPPPAGAV